MSNELPDLDIDAILGEASSERAANERRRALSAQGVSVIVTVGWLAYVTLAGHWERVVDNWVSALTMVFGSFVAGATPQGGGAVAFPVFTKGLEIPSEVARTFSLCIQMIGMGCASAAILIRRRRIEARVYRVAAPIAVVSFLVGYFLLSDRDLPFAPSVLPGAYVKVGFTLLTAAMAYVTFLGYRVHALQVRPRVTTFSTRYAITIAVCATLGGLASSQVGSGSDVLIYLGLVVLAGVSPSVGVPTSVLVMTTVSFVGFFVIGIFDGQLSVGLDALGEVAVLDGSSVASVDGAAVFGTGEPLEAQRFDLFGLWIAAVPVVAWGAPLGSWVTSKLSDRRLVVFVVALAAAEVLTTIIFLDELRSDGALVAFGVVGMIVLFGGLGWLQRNRVRILQLDPVAGDTTFTRSGLDFGPRYREQLGERDDD
ncbi:MAG: sulfite exporter TauE/SafE family protein [Ilumatobacter sp.]